MRSSVRRWRNPAFERRQATASRGAAARKAIVAAARNIQHRVKAEFKTIDNLGVNGAVDTTGSLYLINTCTTGDDITNREGRETLMRSVQVTGITRSTVTNGVRQQHRIMLIYDRQTNAAPPVLLDILAAATVHAPRNLDNRKRFKILMDKKYTVGPDSGVVQQSGESEKIWTFYRKLRHPCSFNAVNGGTITDFISGSLYLLHLGNIAAGGTAGSYTFSSRVRFTDE